jgi:N-carbamoylputrescine amidase
MTPFRVAAVSMNSRLGEADETWAGIERYCAEAAAGGAALALFPELVIHGHCAPDTWLLAETVPDGPSTRRLVELAKQHKLILCVGMAEKDRDIVYNAQVLVGPDGYIGHQRKLHPSRDETQLFKGGDALTVFDIGPARVAIVICYDNELPEVPRLAALRGADVLLMPHAGRASQWSDEPESERRARRLVAENYGLYRLRARENATFCVVTDQAGRAGTVPDLPPEHMNQPHHPGGALIISPTGAVLAATQDERIRDEIIFADLDPAAIATARAHPNYTLRTRRRELFADLA